MGKKAILLLLAAALISAITFAGVTDAQAQQTGTIQGTVLDVLTADPVGGVEVCLSVDISIGCRLTGSDGTWEFTDLPSGSYTIDYTDPEGVYESFSVTTEFVAPGIRIVNASLAPVVEPCDPGFFLWSDGLCRSFPEDGPTPTPTSTPIPPVVATATPFPPTPTATPTVPPVFPPTPTATTTPVPTATAVPATPTATAIPTPTAVLAPGTGLITGTITVLSDGSPVFGAQVCASLAFPITEVCAFSNADGVYVIEDVLPGNYTIEAIDLAGRFVSNCWGQQACALETADRLGVAAGEQALGIDIALDPLFNASFPTPTPAPPSPEGTISGTITLGGSPVAGLVVCAINNVEGPCEVTGTNGSYSIPLLATGNYRVLVEVPIADSLALVCYLDNVGCDSPVPVGVLSPLERTGIDIDIAAVVPAPGPLPPAVPPFPVGTGSISGTVTLDGAPLADAVCATTEPLGSTIVCAVSDSQGRYQLVGLDAGEYFVDVSVPGTGLVCYLDCAESVVVVDGLAIDGIDIDAITGVATSLPPVVLPPPVIPPVLPPPPVPDFGSISGTLTIDGAPSVGELCASFDIGFFFNCAVSDSDGRYEIFDLPAGDYFIEILSPLGAFDCCDTQVTVVEGPVTGIDIELDGEDVLATGSISGTVSFEGTPVANSVCATTQPLSGIVGCTNSDAQGNYELVNLPVGEYFVDVFVPSIGRVCYLDCAERAVVEDGVLTVGIDIDAIAPPVLEPPIVPPPFPPVLPPVPASGGIAGVVSVAPIPAQPVEVCVAGPIFECTTAAPDGTYLVSNLPPGEYSVEVNTSDFVSFWCYDGPGQVSAGCQSATTVTVDGSIVGGIDVSVSALGAVVGSIAEPVAGQQVCIAGLDVPVFECTLTDSLGRFVVQLLPTGSYTVSESATGAFVDIFVASPFVTDIGQFEFLLG